MTDQPPSGWGPGRPPPPPSAPPPPPPQPPPWQQPQQQWQQPQPQPPWQQQYGYQQRPKKRFPVWAIVLLSVFAVIVVLGILGLIGAAVSEDDEIGESVHPADRGVCLQAAQLAKAAQSGSIFEVAARAEALRATRAADPQLEAMRARAAGVISAAETAGTLSPEAAREASAAGQDLGERCVELDALKQSDIEDE